MRPPGWMLLIVALLFAPLALAQGDAEAGRELVLGGSHRFSSYALTFRIDEFGPDRSRLRAESRATFPGVTGGGSRRLVLGPRLPAAARRTVALLGDECTVDDGKARRELGYEGRVSVEAGLADLRSASVPRN